MHSKTFNGLLGWPKSTTLTPPMKWNNRNSHSLMVEYKLYSHFGRQFGGFLQNKTYSYHTIQQPLDLFKGIENYINPAHRCLTAALFINAKTWNQPRGLSIGKWINKLWHI